MSELLDFMRINATQHQYVNKLQNLCSVKELKQFFLENHNDVIFIDVIKTSFPIYYEILEPLIVLK